MAELVVIHWRDIPAQVVVRAGRERAKRHLGERFEAAIDRAAMHAGMAGTDDYLEQWMRADPVTVDGDAGTAAEQAADRIINEVYGNDGKGSGQVAPESNEQGLRPCDIHQCQHAQGKDL